MHVKPRKPNTRSSAASLDQDLHALTWFGQRKARQLGLDNEHLEVINVGGKQGAHRKCSGMTLARIDVKNKTEIEFLSNLRSGSWADVIWFLKKFKYSNSYTHKVRQKLYYTNNKIPHIYLNVFIYSLRHLKFSRK